MISKITKEFFMSISAETSRNLYLSGARLVSIGLPAAVCVASGAILKSSIGSPGSALFGVFAGFSHKIVKMVIEKFSSTVFNRCSSERVKSCFDPAGTFNLGTFLSNGVGFFASALSARAGINAIYSDKDFSNEEALALWGIATGLGLVAINIFTTCSFCVKGEIQPNLGNGTELDVPV